MPISLCFIGLLGTLSWVGFPYTREAKNSTPVLYLTGHLALNSVIQVRRVIYDPHLGREDPILRIHQMTVLRSSMR